MNSKLLANTNFKIAWLLLSLLSTNCFALSWSELWQSKNQQAQEMMKSQNFSKAKLTFEDPGWQAVAAFRDKDYKLAADIFSKLNTPDATYNLGNALANLGKYQEAIDAYNKVLKINKNHQDAAYNKKIIEDILKKQQQQQQKDKQDKNKNLAPKNNANSKPKTDKQPIQNKQKKQQKSSTQPQKNSASKVTQSKIKHKNGKKQMQEQWLKLIPDDPGGLLREKFKRDYLRRRGELSS